MKSATTWKVLSENRKQRDSFLDRKFPKYPVIFEQTSGPRVLLISATAIFKCAV
jgi:hypothetical protein